MKFKKRVMTFALTVILILSIVLSITFIVKETGHSCVGHNCPICQQMEIVAEVLHSQGTGETVFAVINIFFIAIATGILISFRELVSISLVSLKVRLDS